MIWTATGGYLVRSPSRTRGASSRSSTIPRLPDRRPRRDRKTGDMSDETEKTLKESVEAFAQSFQTSEAAAGSEAGRGAGTPPDEVKPDIGWDRMSSVDDDEEGVDGGPSLAEDDVEGQVPLPDDEEADGEARGAAAGDRGVMGAQLRIVRRGSARSSRRRRSRVRWSSSRPRAS